MPPFYNDSHIGSGGIDGRGVGAIDHKTETLPTIPLFSVGGPYLLWQLDCSCKL